VPREEPEGGASEPLCFSSNGCKRAAATSASVVSWRAVAAAPTKARDRVFISYSHRDAPALGPLLDALRNLLRPQQDAGLLRFWFDEDIPAGERWLDELLVAIRETAWPS
jgi:hypothetical protein